MTTTNRLPRFQSDAGRARLVPEPSRYLTVADLRERFHCSRVWIDRRMADHGFPRPVKFGEGVGVARRWLRTDVEAWEASWLVRSNAELLK